MKTYLTVGLLAHVDAGKTTLAESMLYLTGVVREPGRVDHQDAFLDTHELEKARGITIFSQQAVLPLGEKEITLLDTPGHVDFSAEMERTLQVLDYAVLILGGADGVQGHTRTLWHLLERYKIPTFLFVNKMDQPGADRTDLLAEIKEQLDETIVPFDTGEAAICEAAAVCQEEALEEYLEMGSLSRARLSSLIRERKVFPCYFGSALHMEGVKELLSGLDRYADAPAWDDAFGARVFKISRDPKGMRLTHLKLTGGTLKVRESVPAAQEAENDAEKVNQIRIYSGGKYNVVQEAFAGQVVAVTGPTKTRAGDDLGAARGTGAAALEPVLKPVLTYRLVLPEGTDVLHMLEDMRLLEEEDPMLQVLWEEGTGEIHIRLMGEIQTQVLKSLIKERFGVDVDFGPGSIVYQETIRNTVEGIGYFESSRHYAKVHLLLESGEPGSGMVVKSACRDDQPGMGWQRQVLAYLKEKVYRGVLMGAPLTDVKITLTDGKVSEKNTSGADLRQAADRAVRQGLMQAQSVLLEPWYAFRLELPAQMAGRAMTDIQWMSGSFDPPQTSGDRTILTGEAPVSELEGYQKEVASYSRGAGRLSCTVSGYRPCHNAAEVIEKSGYDPGPDMGEAKKEHPVPAARQWDPEEDDELEEIFLRTYGRIRRADVGARTVKGTGEKESGGTAQALREYLLVDGYNVIHAWDDLWALAQEDFGAARDRLQDILCNYQGFTGDTVILVFDAYKVEGSTLEVRKYHNIFVVYTKEAETADQYIEKVVHEIGHKYHVTVVTSDGVEQVITLGSGGSLKSSREFRAKVDAIQKEIREEIEKWRSRDARQGQGKQYLFDDMEEDLAREMDDIRLGKRKPDEDL